MEDISASHAVQEEAHLIQSISPVIEDTRPTPVSPAHHLYEHSLAPPLLDTSPLPPSLPATPPPSFPSTTEQNKYPQLSRRQAAFLMMLASILIFQALTLGPTQFLGSKGWASLFQTRPNTITNLLKHPTSDKNPGQSQMSPQQYLQLLLHNMTLDQKLGQMLMVQFTGAAYSESLSQMIDQYNVGNVLLFYANGNILNANQLTSLTQQIQTSSEHLPLSIAIDQEGGNVDRLWELDGPRPAAATIGASHDPTQAQNAGSQDAHDLASYGINLNLAPVADVDTLYTSEIHQDLRAYGTTASTVTEMAGAYLRGLQASGKVVGTLKHFPGLGNVSVDPHRGLPVLNRTRSQLDSIDWAPYRDLIQQSDLVHAIMVTHEIVSAIDSTLPASLSAKVIQNVLRDEMGYQGVILTDSLSMQGISAYYTEAQAAVLAVKAGADMIMGASSPGDAATIIEGLKQAITDGNISLQRIDMSIERILSMKYAMGLLPLTQQK